MDQRGSHIAHATGMRGQAQHGSRHRKSASDTFAFTGEDWQTMLEPLHKYDNHGSVGGDFTSTQKTAPVARGKEQVRSAARHRHAHAVAA